jgi:hypothetical protein
MSNQFFVVWNPKGRNPSMCHETHKAAQDEAVRLAKSNPDQDFYVMEALNLVRKVDVQITTLKAVQNDQLAF